MRHRTALAAATSAVAIGACQPTVVNTIPAPVASTADVQRLDVDLPADLEIRAINFSPTTYANVRGTPQMGTSSEVAGRAFIQVWGVHRGTGENYLILYEDVTHRRRPVQIIHFVAGSDRARVDSAP